MTNLRLMVYDETDVTSNLRRLKTAGSLPLGMDFLDINVPVGLTHSWYAGGRLFRALRRIDLFHGHRVWYRALEWLATVSPEKKIGEIQYWGHGSPGRVWMDGHALTAQAFDGPMAKLLEAVRVRLAPNALIWFRTCATFGAQAGFVFARSWAENMTCRVAGHTHNIGLWQSGLHSLTPGQHPRWSLVEGVDEGTPLSPIKMQGSGPCRVNTINCLRTRFPDTW